jgi:VanZ family protein
MTLIFCLSTDAGSFPHTFRLVHPILRWLFPHVSQESVRAVVLVVRKCAHLSEYAVLALLLWRAWQHTLRQNIQPWHSREAALALAVSVLYAASDEYHQSFVPSRGASLRDVLIDAVGAALGLLVAYLVCAWSASRKASAAQPPRLVDDAARPSTAAGDSAHR